MAIYKVTFDLVKYKPTGRRYGENSRWFIEGDTPQEAINSWNERQLAGNRLNPWYLKFEESVFTCSQCNLGEEIHVQANGDLLCEICGWIVKRAESDKVEQYRI